MHTHASNVRSRARAMYHAAADNIIRDRWSISLSVDQMCARVRSGNILSSRHPDAYASIHRYTWIHFIRVHAYVFTDRSWIHFYFS